MTWHRRMLWRRRGAWLWPAFVALILVDAVIGHGLPPAGQSESLYAAGLLGLVFNVLGVLLLSRPLGVLVRRRRPDLPGVVARDYAGTAVVVAITVLLAGVGVAHRQTVLDDQQAMHDAVTRAQAYIGDRAPPEFQRNLRWVSLFAIQPGSIYRACVPSAVNARTYCVVVNTTRPFPGGVTFSGYEPNSTFSAGVW